ncbi:MAG: bifunctional adenosylcobinamide kinase/adenosylcobinamide-phosphate guanylyltransferase, partial [Chroococcales cyanobacterium]
MKLAKRKVIDLLSPSFGRLHPLTTILTRFSQTAKTLILVTGPARSGKSEWAETLATQTGKNVIYIATAEINSDDQEWLARIEKHRKRRSPTWETREIPKDLIPPIQTATASSCLLVDSLGTWVANYLDSEENTWETVLEALLESLQQTPADVIFVAEETGWGVIPAYPLGRTFRD